MLDTVLRQLFAVPLDRLTALLAQRFSNARWPAVTGFAVALAGAAAIAHHWLWPGLILFAIGRVLCAVSARLDGAVPSQLSVFSAVNLASLPLAFAFDDPARALSALFLTFALAGHGAAQAVFRNTVIGESEFLVILALVACFPNLFGLAAYGMGVAYFVSTGVAVARGAE